MAQLTHVSKSFTNHTLLTYSLLAYQCLLDCERGRANTQFAHALRVQVLYPFSTHQFSVYSAADK